MIVGTQRCVQVQELASVRNLILSLEEENVTQSRLASSQDRTSETVIGFISRFDTALLRQPH